MERVCARARVSACSSPRPGLSCRRSVPGAVRMQKQTTVSAFERGISNSLHFLFHKICKNNAIILILEYNCKLCWH